MKYIDFINMKNFEQFKYYGIKISEKNNFPQYYVEFLNKKKHICYYFQSQEYIQMVKDSRYRFILIDFENDQVCILYKIIEFMGNKSIKVIGMPVSKNNKYDNIVKVVNHMCMLNFYVSILIDDEEKNFYNITYLKPSKQDYNYYSSYQYVVNKFTNKYKKKHCLKNLEKNSNYLFTQSLTNKQTNEILSLFDLWSHSKGKVSGVREFKNAIKYSDKNVYFLLLYYKSELVLFRVLIKQDNGFMSVFCFSKTRDKTNDIVRNRDLHNVVLYSQYITVMHVYRHFNIDKLYVLGAMPSEKSLLEYKQNNNEDKNLYYILKKDDWRKNYEGYSGSKNKDR